MSQEKSKTMPMQIFGGVKEVHYGICANSESRNHRFRWNLGSISGEPMSLESGIQDS